MEVILTHEQADFDAIASQLGVHLLNKEAIPVLPRRMNRNVRAFLNLYGAGLPFVEFRDLPLEKVEAITLVDTQSLVSVKGVRDDTRVRVIDHHAKRVGIPENWEVFTVEVGANTTILVEWLHDRGHTFNVITATLFLLGIYEDTGSLTYGRTTARDLMAAAFLLEQGADLKLASDFLNHPLSLQQETLYNRLRDQAKGHEINGHLIVVTEGDGSDIDEELSTIVHKLWNFLDPDALFAIIKVRGGVQIIARSSTDKIDVAEILGHFGGGGHSMAAAALVHEAEVTCSAISQKLTELLPNHVHHPITVAQIMSSVPHLLTSDTSAVEAAQYMQRYGYEGFPVVKTSEKGTEVVGLLTRRSVDRAIAHQLNLTAQSLMQAGKVTVSPYDSIATLQTLMLESGWGQIPVVDPKSGEIIGIVTRTDLLKTLTSKPLHQAPQNLSQKLERVLPRKHLSLLKAVAQCAQEEHMQLYIVGGFVRDLILDRPSLDFDLVVEGDAIALARTLVKKYGGRVTSHVRFGTAKWYLEEVQFDNLEEETSDEESPGLPSTSVHEKVLESLDLITARLEFYTYPTALPTIERSSIKLDLHRRDFTINTLAIRLDGSHYGELLDYWGGYEDLTRGVIRVLHSLSFVDDPTRMLRAVRYEQRYGFQIEERTLQLLLEARPLLARVSGERIRNELDHILDEENSVLMMERLDSLELLKAIHPDLIWTQEAATCIENLSDEQPPNYWKLPRELVESKNKHLRRWLSYAVWFIHIPCHSINNVIKRLRMPQVLRNGILAACDLWKKMGNLVAKEPSKITAVLDKMPSLALYVVYIATEDQRHKDILFSYVTDWRDRTANIDGYELKKRGVQPGPAYSRILGALRDAWLDGRITTLEDERALFERLLLEEKVSQ